MSGIESENIGPQSGFTQLDGGSTEAPIDQEEDLEVDQEELSDSSEHDEAYFEVQDDEVIPVKEEEITPEPEPEVVEEKPKPKVKKHHSLKTEFNKVQREKYQALNEIEQLRQENQRLAKLAAQTAEAATFHNEKAVELKLDQARRAKAAAYEMSDTEAMIKADEQFAEAIHQKAEIDRWKAEQAYQKQQQEFQAKQQQERQKHQQEAQPEYDLNEDTENWLSSNPWFLQGNEEYNPELAEDVQDFSKILERRYARAGMQDKIFSQEYFDEIDNYIAQNYSDSDDSDYDDEVEYRKPVVRRPPVQQQPRRVVPQPGKITMKNVRNNVAPVGKSAKAPGANQNSNRVVLSAKEREFAKTMGISEAEYAKQKLAIDKSGKYSYERNQR